MIDVADHAFLHSPELLRTAAALMQSDGVVLVRLAPLDLNDKRLQVEAQRLFRRVRAYLVAYHGLPQSVEVVEAEAQTSNVPAGRTFRSLLPHHDGGHSTYLSPSLLCMPDWDASRRRMPGEAEFTNEDSHKLVHALLVLDPGRNAHAETDYYDLPILLRDAWARKFDREPDLPSVMSWLGESIDLAHQGRLPYLPLGLVLGLRDCALAYAALHEAHGVVPDFALSKGCTCTDPAERALCAATTQAFGTPLRTWRRRYEQSSVPQQADLLIANNVRMLHSGLGGGRGRVLKPYYLAGTAAGDDYESWLAGVWLESWDHSTGSRQPGHPTSGRRPC